MKFTFFISFVLTLVVASCSYDTPHVEVAVNQDLTSQKKEVPVDVLPTKLLKMNLEGMVCQMGCGGAIRKELNATKAVANCDFDFEEDRAVDLAMISFDENKITAEKIIDIVSEMNGGQFDVGSVTIEPLKE